MLETAPDVDKASLLHKAELSVFTWFLRLDQSRADVIKTGSTAESADPRVNAEWTFRRSFLLILQGI